MIVPELAFIDDEPDLLELGDYLFGAEVLKFSNPKDFLVQADLSKIRCIVTDFMMPAMRGDELAKHLRGNGFGGLIILMSGNADVKEQVDVCLFDEIFNKPPTDPEKKKMEFLGLCFGGKTS